MKIHIRFQRVEEIRWPWQKIKPEKVEVALEKELESAIRRSVEAWAHEKGPWFFYWVAMKGASDRDKDMARRNYYRAESRAGGKIEDISYEDGIIEVKWVATIPQLMPERKVAFADLYKIRGIHYVVGSVITEPRAKITSWEEWREEEREIIDPEGHKLGKEVIGREKVEREEKWSTIRGEAVIMPTTQVFWGSIADRIYKIARDLNEEKCKEVYDLVAEGIERLAKEMEWALGKWAKEELFQRELKTWRELTEKVLEYKRFCH